MKPRLKKARAGGKPELQKLGSGARHLWAAKRRLSHPMSGGLGIALFGGRELLLGVNQVGEALRRPISGAGREAAELSTAIEFLVLKFVCHAQLP